MQIEGREFVRDEIPVDLWRNNRVSALKRLQAAIDELARPDSKQLRGGHLSPSDRRALNHPSTESINARDRILAVGLHPVRVRRVGKEFAQWDKRKAWHELCALRHKRLDLVQDSQHLSLFVDGAIENYMTEAIIPAATKEDPRYYTMGKGGFVKRTGYAVSRLFITRTNSGGRTFNLSEIVGAGAAAGIGNAYYPAEPNPWVKTYQRWGTQVGLDGVFNVLKEFWPDIDQAVFHGKY